MKILQIKKPIFKTKKEFINYFIYTYEYTFLLNREMYDLEKLLNDICQDLPNELNMTFEEINKLWDITYLNFHKKICKECDCFYLEKQIEKIISNYDNFDINLFELNVELINSILLDAKLPFLELRPFERFQLKTQNKFILKYISFKDEIITFFNNNINMVSKTKISVFKYFKGKNCLIEDENLLFEVFFKLLDCIFDDIEQYEENEMEFEVTDVINKNVSEIFNHVFKTSSLTFYDKFLEFTTKIFNELKLIEI